MEKFSLFFFSCYTPHFGQHPIQHADSPSSMATERSEVKLFQRKQTRTGFNQLLLTRFVPVVSGFLSEGYFGVLCQCAAAFWNEHRCRSNATQTLNNVWKLKKEKYTERNSSFLNNHLTCWNNRATKDVTHLATYNWTLTSPNSLSLAVGWQLPMSLHV